PRFDGVGGSGVENWSCVRSSIFSPPNKSVQHFPGCTQTANTWNSNCLKDLPLSRRFGVDLEPGMEKLPIRGRNCAVPPRKHSERARTWPRSKASRLAACRFAFGAQAA